LTFQDYRYTEQIMNASPVPTISAAALMDRELPRCSEILSPLLASNASALVYGPGGVGKSFFALGLAWAAASGGSFLGWHAPKPRRVHFVDGELGAVAVRERLALFGPPPPTLKLVLPEVDDEAPAINLAQREGQYRLMESWGNPELVVLHTVSSLAALPRCDGEATHALQRFLRHQHLSGRAVVLVDEATPKGPARSTMRGLNALDTVIALRHPPGWQPADGARFEIHFEKTRLAGEDAEPVLAELLPPGPDGVAAWRWETIARDKLERAVRLLKRGLSAEAMGDALEISRAQAFRLQRQARQRGLVPKFEGAKR
jgi:hypothetical protein